MPTTRIDPHMIDSTVIVAALRDNGLEELLQEGVVKVVAGVILDSLLSNESPFRQRDPYALAVELAVLLDEWGFLPKAKLAKTE